MGRRKGGPEGKALDAIATGMMAIGFGCACVFSDNKIINAISSLAPYCFIFGALLVAFGVLSIVLRRKKGAIGEKIVSMRLRKALPKDDYLVLDDVYLPIDGATTQIDHIVVSQYGVFVVETKNYTGWIFASADSPKWTQTTYKEKDSFQNPIRQNYRHICAISENLGIPKELLHGVVAFTGDCQFKTDMPKGVVYSRKAAEYIRSFTKPIIKYFQIQELYDAIKEWNDSVTPEQRAAHVANLKKRHGANSQK